MQDIDTFDLEFYEYSLIADDPKKLERLQNHFYDDEWDEFLEEFDKEQEEKQKLYSSQSLQDDKSESMSDEAINDIPIDTDYEVSENTNISDWEEVN